jgi:hypothetical protein
VAEKTTTKFGGVCHMQARSLDIPNDPHPNKMPFTGIMTKIDEPSDAAPDGANGKRVMITKEAAENALDSLFGMAVDFTPDWDGHDPQKKIGVITSAEVVDNAIHIGGFIWSADFEQEAAFIKANKKKLGFSFEARDLMTTDIDADPVPICECVFTGAAILFKDKAAYTTTSINAAKAKDGEAETIQSPEDFLMSDEVKNQIASIAASVAELAKSVAAQSDAINKMNDEKVAAANHLVKVEQHAKELEKAADHMDAAGIGGDPVRGHAAVLRDMAGDLRANAARGVMPAVYNRFYAAAEAKTETKVDVAAEVKAAAEKVTAEMTKQLTELKAAADANEKALKDQLASAKTEIDGLKAKAQTTETAEDVKRKTLSPSTLRLLAKSSIELPEGEGKLSLADLDKGFKAAGLDTEQRMTIKTQLAAAGLID